MSIIIKPTDYPNWANLNPVDGASGQNAIIAPNNTKINNGYGNQERPPRQDLNWFQNEKDKWDNYLKQILHEDYINGFDMSGGIRSVSTLTYSFFPGSAMDSTNTQLISSLGDPVWKANNGFTKRLQSNFEAGPYVKGINGNGIPAAVGSSLGNADWVYSFVLLINTSGVLTLDIGYDTSVDATNLLAEVTDIVYFRRIGSFLPEATRPKIQSSGEEFVPSEGTFSTNHGFMNSNPFLSLTLPLPPTAYGAVVSVLVTNTVLNLTYTFAITADGASGSVGTTTPDIIADFNVNDRWWGRYKKIVFDPDTGITSLLLSVFPSPQAGQIEVTSYIHSWFDRRI